MNKIITQAVVLFALAGSSLFANTQEQDLENTQTIENSFPYVSASMEGRLELCPGFGGGGGDFFLVPGLGLGYRMQKNHYGLDLSMSFSRLLGDDDSENRLTADILYDYFFNPSLESQYYAGVGIAIDCTGSYFFDNGLPLPFPKVVLGKQYKNTFVEVQVYSMFFVSGVSLKCGIGF